MTLELIKRKQRAPLHAKPMVENTETSGELEGFEPSRHREFLAVHISGENVLLPATLRADLERLRGQRVAVTLIKKKHHLRALKGEPRRCP